MYLAASNDDTTPKISAFVNVAFTMANGAELQTAPMSAVVMTAVSIANTSCCADNQDCFRGKLRLDFRARYLSVSIAFSSIFDSSAALGECSG